VTSLILKDDSCLLAQVRFSFNPCHPTAAGSMIKGSGDRKKRGKSQLSVQRVQTREIMNVRRNKFSFAKLASAYRLSPVKTSDSRCSTDYGLGYVDQFVDNTDWKQQ